MLNADLGVPSSRAVGVEGDDDAMPKLDTLPNAEPGLAVGCGTKLNAAAVLTPASEGFENAPDPNDDPEGLNANADTADADGFSLLGAKLNAGTVDVVAPVLAGSASLDDAAPDSLVAAFSVSFFALSLSAGDLAGSGSLGAVSGCVFLGSVGLQNENWTDPILP